MSEKMNIARSAASPHSQTPQESMVAFCEDLLQQVKDGRVQQMFVVIEQTGSTAHAPMLFLAGDVPLKEAREFVEDICACVANVMDRAHLSAVHTPHQSGPPLLH